MTDALCSVNVSWSSITVPRGLARLSRVRRTWAAQAHAPHSTCLSNSETSGLYAVAHVVCGRGHILSQLDMSWIYFLYDSSTVTLCQEIIINDYHRLAVHSTPLMLPNLWHSLKADQGSTESAKETFILLTPSTSACCSASSNWGTQTADYWWNTNQGWAPHTTPLKNTWTIPELSLSCLPPLLLY